MVNCTCQTATIVLHLAVIASLVAPEGEVDLTPATEWV